MFTKLAIFSYPDARNCRLSTLFHHYHTKTTKKGFTSNSILVAVVFTPFFEMYFTYLFILQRFFLVHFKVVLGKKTRVVLIPQIKRDTILLQLFLHHLEILLESNSYFLKRSDCLEVNENNLFCNPTRLSGLGHQTMSLTILEGNFFSKEYHKT